MSNELIAGITTFILVFLTFLGSIYVEDFIPIYLAIAVCVSIILLIFILILSILDNFR